MSDSVVAALAESVASGGIKVIDLTETLRPEYPTIQLPEEFSQAWGFKKEVISEYDDRGPAWTWSNFSMNEHTGTHLDAPAHWVTGKDIPNGTVDTMDTAKMIAPVCVLDCTAEVAADKGFILTKDFVLDWEAEHGKIPAGSWVFLRSDWRKVADPDNYTNVQEDGAHSPGPDGECVLFLIEERDVLGFGCETVGTDAGQAFAMEPAYPCHHYMHGAGRLGLQCMTNLDLLPPTGAVVIATPLKIIEGSGSPLRVVALVSS
ncbi:MAG: cyclase family protein [Pseudomonadota bacterium]